MKYYSTNKQAPEATLEEAVVKGLAADKGLFMPFTIKTPVSYTHLDVYKRQVRSTPMGSCEPVRMTGLFSPSSMKLSAEAV